MKIARTLAFTRRTLLQFKHDRRTLAFILVMPLLMILIFGYTFGGEPRELEVGVIDLDEKVRPPGAPMNVSLADMIIDNLDKDTFVLRYYSDLETARSDLRDEKVWAVIFFPANFTKNMVLRLSAGDDENGTSRIGLHLDNTNPNIVSSIVKGVQASLTETRESISNTLAQPTETEPIVIDSSYEYTYVEEIEFIDYFAPGVISFAIMMITTMLTIILFVNERRNGTLERLLASPASESEIVLGYALAFGLLGLLQSIVVLVAAILIFDIMIVGNIFLALGIVLLLAFGHQGLGILLSAGAKNELQAVQFIPLVLFPSILLAGLFWPVESIPSYLQPLSYVIPLRYCIDAERAIMLKGCGIGDVWLEVLVLVVFAVLSLGGSILLLRRRKD